MTSIDLQSIMQNREFDDIPELERISVILPAILQYLQGNEMCARLLNMDQLSGASIDFQLEREQRILVDARGFVAPEWETDVEDIYDISGTIRLRKKCGAPRVSIKIPVPDLNTYRVKSCLRIEIKPGDDVQRAALIGLRDELLADKKLQVLHKRGTRIKLTDGRMAWLNQNDAGKCWIEVDGPEYEVENNLPAGITYLGHQKSSIGSSEVVQLAYDQFLASVNHNTRVTSRTAKGVVDTSVSQQKKGTSLTTSEVSKQVEDNSQEVSQYIWDNKFIAITSAAQLKTIFLHIASLVNTGSQDGLKLRSWDVPYGYKVESGSTLEYALDELYNQAWLVLRAAEKGRIEPYKAAAWLEWMVDGGLHPWVDGCGRIAKAWSAFFLSRMERRLPEHESRDAYYSSFNAGLNEFVDYYTERASKIQ